MPDPKLIEAMEEIKAVLKKHDVGAVVVLGSQTHMEHLLEIDPSWSCVRVEKLADGGHGLRFRALGADFPSREAHKQCVEESIGLLMGLADCLRVGADELLQVVAMVGKKLPFDHFTRADPPPDQGLE